MSLACVCGLTVLLEELLYKPKHSLIVQTLHPVGRRGDQRRRVRRRLVRRGGHARGRSHEIVVLSDHGQTEGATFKQCNGEGFVSFHGGLGGPQTRPFIFHSPRLSAPSEPIIGAAAVHEVLTGWRQSLNANHP